MFLGVVFDRKFIWKTHMERIVEKSKKVLNIMRCLAGLSWGANFDGLESIYVMLIRSTIDYGCVLYGA